MVPPEPLGFSRGEVQKKLDRTAKISAMATADVVSESVKLAGVTLVVSAVVPPVVPVAVGLYLLCLPGEVLRAVERAASKIDND